MALPRKAGLTMPEHILTVYEQSQGPCRGRRPPLDPALDSSLAMILNKLGTRSSTR